MNFVFHALENRWYYLSNSENTDTVNWMNIYEREKKEGTFFPRRHPRASPPPRVKQHNIQLTDDDDDCCCWTVAEANEPLEWVFEWRARGRRGIKTENYFFFVPFGLKLISTVRERSRVLVGGGILGRLDFLFASLLAFFIIHSPVLSLDDDDDEKWKETSEHFPSPLSVAFWTVGQSSSSSGGIVWMES